MGDVYAEYMKVLKRPDVVLASNKSRKKVISEFKEKYPNANMSKFDFEVDVDLSGKVTGVVVNYKVDEDTSYDITSDGFKSNPEWVKFLSSFVPTRDGWSTIWASGGIIPKFSNLREPKHEWGIHHYPVFQKAVNLGYPLHNFKVYVSDTDYFYSKFNPIKLYDWKNKAVLYENNRGTDALPSDVESDIRNVIMDYENEPYFAQICSAYIATFLCGISIENLEWNYHTPKQITSIARYHLYYTMRKFIKNPELMKAYDLSGMKGYLPVSIQSFNGASHGGGTYVKAGWVNYSNSDHLHFIPYKSDGITQVGVQLLMDSVESYVYSVLGAQAKTRWSIVSSQLGKSLQTQQAFRRIVNDTGVQTNVNVTISNMRTAIRDTNVILNMAINPNIILIPSRLIILETPIPGYNNILSSPIKTTKVGGLVEGDIDMGDSSDIVNLRDPTNAKDAVNKQWVTNNFTRIIPSGKYVEKLHHKVAQWVWGYRGVALANTRYHAYCHDQIPPSWRTDTINSLANINLETITIKSNSSILADITNVNLELILRVSIYVKQSNGKFTQQKKDIVLGTIDLARLQNCYFLGTYQSDGRNTACYAFKGNSEYYIGGQAELVDNTMAWCVIVKPEQSMPTGKSMDMSFCWSLLYSGANGG
jgi:hypothetical protein